MEELVRVPGARWRVEEAIKLAKSAAGMADYEVRSCHGWYRHITLAQLAAAFLAVQDARAARERAPVGHAAAAERGGGRQSRSTSIVPMPVHRLRDPPAAGADGRLSSRRPSGSGTVSPGRAGGAATRPWPATATDSATAPASPCAPPHHRPDPPTNYSSRTDLQLKG